MRSQKAADEGSPNRTVFWREAEGYDDGFRTRIRGTQQLEQKLHGYVLQPRNQEPIRKTPKTDQLDLRLSGEVSTLMTSAGEVLDLFECVGNVVLAKPVNEEAH